MWQSIILFFILGLSIVVFVFCQNTEKNKNKPIANIQNIKDSIINNGKPMNKKEIEEKLKILAKSEAPDPQSLKVGAMCYAPSRLPPTIDYICPVCGEKTIYTLRQDYNIIKNLPQSRSIAKALNSYGITIDESSFCAKCRKNDTENPTINLIIKYTDQPEPRIIKGISLNDLVILQEFLNDKKIHKGANDREEPLKKYTDRLSYLLGIELNK